MTRGSLLLFPGLFFVAWIVFWLVFAVGGTVAWIWALIDACQRPEWEYGYAGTTKIMWVILVALLGGIGALIYYFAVRAKLEVVKAAYLAGTLHPEPWPRWPPPGGFCRACGAPQAYGTRYCSHCGAARSQPVA